MASVSAESDVITLSTEKSVVLADEFRARPNRGLQSFRSTFRLPNEITCSLCDKPKNQRGFSDMQKRKMIEAKGDYSMICLTCSGVNQQEWTCAMCDRTMARNKFASSQRRKGSEAECFDCVAERIAEPMDDGSDSSKHVRFIEASKGTDHHDTTLIRVEENKDKGKTDPADVPRRWIAQAMDGIGNLDIGGEEWSDGDSVASVESSDSDASHFSI